MDARNELFDRQLSILEDPASNDAAIERTIADIRAELIHQRETHEFPECHDARELCIGALDYWRECIAKLHAMTQLADLAPIINKYFAVTNQYNCSHFNAVRCASMATTHIMWRRLAQICPNPECPCRLNENPGMYHFRACIKQLREKGFANVAEFANWLEEQKNTDLPAPQQK